ncbi:MAG: glycosyltransferase family 39 protein [Candidatus Omnitrophica bacterium]|nr:glycosyltransferase family 39 protein [Candidatus Omnitrophota bacterium]
MRQNVKIDTLILIIILIFHFGANFVWLSIDENPFLPDEIFHIHDYHSFYSGIKDINVIKELPFISIKKIFLLFNISTQAWPRFVYFTSYLFTLFLGYSIFTLKISNMLYFAILIFSLYFIGRKCLDAKTGLLAAFMVSFYPGVCGISRVYGIDFPLAAMASLTTLFLLLSENFSRRKYSIFFGISLGIGFLVKGTILLFVSGIIGYIFFRILKDRDLQLRRQRLRNFYLSILTALVISSVWWFGNFKEIYCNLYVNIIGRTIGYPHTVYQRIFYYLTHIIEDISVIFLVIFIAGFFLAIKNKMRHIIEVSLWIIIPYVLLSMMAIKNGRYYAPSYPAFALITAYGISSIQSKRIRRFFTIFVVIMSMALFYKLSFNIGFFPRINIVEPYRWHLAKKIPPYWIDRYCHSPVDTNYKDITEKIVGMIQKKEMRSDKKILIGLETECVDFDTVRILHLIKYYIITEYESYILKIEQEERFYENECMELDYVIVVTDVGSREGVYQEKKYFSDEKHEKLIEVMKEIAYPIRKEIVLYKNIAK